MRIGLLSDTHSFLDPQILEVFKDCDEVWHGGDFGSMEVAEALLAFKPLVGVYGNIDGSPLRRLFPEHQVFEREGLRIWMTHIGGYPGKYPKAIKAGLLQHSPNFFICGHSHILKILPDEQHGLLHLNPGACGREGWHKMRTVLRFELAGGRLQNLELIELGTRG